MRRILTGVEPVIDPMTGALLAIVIREGSSGDEHNFVTPPEFSLQVGVNFYAQRDRIPAHVHPPQDRHISGTQEFVYIKRGRVRLDLYTLAKVHVASIELRAGDSAMLAEGGHGFDILEDAIFVQVKQGPFVASSDKVRFDSA